MARPPKTVPFVDLGFAKVDLARAGRCGAAEVVFGQGKTTLQIRRIAAALKKAGQPVLITRAGPEVFRAVRGTLPGSRYHAEARLIMHRATPASPRRTVCVCCAGTSDIPVAEEAACTAEFFGNTVERCYDVGVAGLHRLTARLETIRRSQVLIVVAGMEGALPSVVAGLVDRPVIAVPTSNGYGANLAGITALLGMLTSCGSGVTVVNIDNGFGAGYAATQITRQIAPS